MSSHLILKIFTARTSFVHNGRDTEEIGIVIRVANRNVVVTCYRFICPRIGVLISAVCNFIVVFFL